MYFSIGAQNQKALTCYPMHGHRRIFRKPYGNGCSGAVSGDSHRRLQGGFADCKKRDPLGRCCAEGGRIRRSMRVPMVRHKRSLFFADISNARRGIYSALENISLPTPQSGHAKSSGRSSNFVPGQFRYRDRRRSRRIPIRMRHIHIS